MHCAAIENRAMVVAGDESGWAKSGAIGVAEAKSEELGRKLEGSDALMVSVIRDDSVEERGNISSAVGQGSEGGMQRLDQYAVYDDDDDGPCRELPEVSAAKVAEK